jgi:disulfide bond formation protein DsbB
MYPLVLLIAVGIYRKDKNLPYYVLPLSISGMAIAFYHVLLQKGLLPEAASPCTLGATCTTKFVGYFGFITIPVMSLTAFSVVTLLMVLYIRRFKK